MRSIGMCGKGLEGVRVVVKSMMKMQVSETLAFEHRIQSHHLNKHWYWSSISVAVMLAFSSSHDHHCQTHAISFVVVMRLRSITACPAE
jgi:hypothetical protein